MANTVTGRNFETAFHVPESSVVGPEANVRQLVIDRFQIPEEQDLALRFRTEEGRYAGYLGQLTFVDWESDDPEIQVAPVQVNIYGPGFLAKAWARALRREAKASVNITVLQAKPLGGGDPQGKMDDVPHPLSSQRELVTVG